jgi:lipopolysaccharide/colanic/teichoic acid biosynthesis glycosyltransferase
MDAYVIIVAGPSIPRAKEFAEILSKRLPKAAVIDCHSFLPPEKTEEEATSLFSEEYLRQTIAQKYGEPYLIIYSDNILSRASFRQIANLKVYVEVDDLDLTSDALLHFQESEKTKKPSTKGARKKQGLSADIQRIIKSEQERIESEVISSKPYADIVIAQDEEAEEAVISIVQYIQRTDSRENQKKLSQTERKNRIEQMEKQLEKSIFKTRKAKIKRKLWTNVIKTTLLFKRIVDIAVSLTALLLLSPLFAIVALCIKLTDGGSVIYVQTRIGKQGKPFPFPKFRSMVMNADKLKDNLLNQAERKGDVTFKMKKDPRVTWIGRFIRRFSIDELPQIWCVLKGDMSIVGPRPPVPREVALYTQEDRRRLEVTPGLTGIWQVSGRSDIGFKQQVELDVLYIESHGFWLDLKLIFKTIPAVLTGKGAY